MYDFFFKIYFKFKNKIKNIQYMNDECFKINVKIFKKI